MIESSKRQFYTLLAVFILSFISAIFHFGIQHTESRDNPEISTPLFPKSGIGLLTLSGPISGETFPSGIRPQGLLSILNKIHSVEKNNSVKAVVVRINSPGGTVGASQEIYSALTRLKNNRKIPIVISVGDMAASGGFWVAMSGDAIFANPGSLVGSIGVILQNYNLEDLAETLGIDVHTYKSGPFKDLLSSFRPTTPAEKQLVQSMIESIQDQFVEAVMHGRNLPKKTVLSIADGRVMTGSQAKAIGLIDELGGLDNAISFTGKMVGLGPNPTILEQDTPGVQQLFQLLQQQTQILFSGIFSTFFTVSSPSLQAR